MGGRGGRSGLQSTAPAAAPAPKDPSAMTLEEYLGPQGSAKTLDDAMHDANPHFMESLRNHDPAYTHNCQRCIWAVELQRRGYDVEAMPRTSDDTYARANPSFAHSFSNVGDPPLDWSNPIGGLWWKPKAADVKNEILKYPDGARGALIMHSSRSGHVCNWEIVKGKVVIYDGQVDQKHSLTDLLRRGYSSFMVARMDNTGISDLAKDFVKRRGT